MILYFDSYITDTPLTVGAVSKSQALRERCGMYAMPEKIDIAKYTLYSYSKLNWSKVLIRCELDYEEYKIHEFESFISEIFKNKTYIKQRSDKLADFRESWEQIKDVNDNWIFLSGNNDHPMLWQDDHLISHLLSVGEKLAQKSKFVSIVYSHFSEFYNFKNPRSPFYKNFAQSENIFYEDEKCFAISRPIGDFSGVQILNKNLFRHWFVDSKYDGRVIRSECLRDYVPTFNQIMIIPKNELCAHFDGHSNTEGGYCHIDPSRVPPLFIPPGFFSGNVKLNFTKKYIDNTYVNFGFKKDKYCFQSTKSFIHLKGGFNSIPTLWLDKISDIKFDEALQQRYVDASKEDNMLRKNPYKIFPFIFTMDFIKFFVFFLKDILKGRG